MHTSSSREGGRADCSCMLALIDIQILTIWEQRIEVLRAASERVLFFKDTSRSDSMLRKWGTIVCHSEEHKNFICLLDGVILEQIVSTDIWDRDLSFRHLVPENNAPSFPREKLVESLQ